MSQDKRFPASARKLRKAREDGDVAKSRDFTAAVVLTSTFLWIFFLFGWLDHLVQSLRGFFALGKDFQLADVVTYLNKSVFLAVGVAGACLLVSFFAALLGEISQVGIRFSLKSLTLNFGRLNPASGFKKLLGIDGSPGGFPRKLLFDAGKYFTLLIISALFIGLILQLAISGMLAGRFADVGQILDVGKYLFARLTVLFSLLLFCIGIVDLIVQRHRRAQRLRMDIEEFKREIRENEGNPEVKGMRKQRHHEIVLHSIVEGVRKARVMIVGGKN